MSEPFESDPLTDRPAPADMTDDADVRETLPALSARPRIVQAQPLSGALSDERRASGMTAAVQAAAVAAGGFVAGAAVVGLVHRRQRHSSSLARGRRAGREMAKGGGTKGGGGRGARAVELVQIVGSRSLLVDVHLLGSGEDR
jgi:uncharacterized membrane protein YgcG